MKSQEKHEPIADRRLMDRALRRGQITHKEYATHVKSLPDVQTKSAPLSDPDSDDHE